LEKRLKVNTGDERTEAINVVVACFALLVVVLGSAENAKSVSQNTHGTALWKIAGGETK